MVKVGGTPTSALVACLLWLVLASCATTPDGYDERMQDTYAYLIEWEHAIEGAASDRGWSMLSPAGRRGFESEAQYVSLAEGADWSAFEIQPLVGHCDDLFACNISILIPGGPESTPEYLLSSPNDRRDTAFWLLHFNNSDQDGDADPPDPDLGNAQVQVWWERVPWPDPGIGGGGG